MRQYRCWIRTGFATSLYCLLMIAVFFTISMFSTGLELHAALRNIPYFPALAGLMFALLMINSAYLTYLPVYLSFGSTRRSARWGMQLMGIAIALGSTAITALTCLIPGEVSRSLLPMLPALFFLQLMLASVGHLVGCTTVRHPKWGTALNLLCVFLVCGGGGGIGGYLAGSGELPVLPAALQPLPCAAAAAAGAAVMMFLSASVQSRMLETYEVRL